MIKKLVLIRHAKSDWNVGVDDFYRPLNERGKQDAPKMGKFLKSIGLIPDVVLCSSAERTRSTARLIAHELSFPLLGILENKALYHASSKDILQQVTLVNPNTNTLFVIGHNPGISDFLSYLVDDTYELKTCCVAVLEPQVEKWTDLFQGTCLLKSYFSPREIE